MKRSSMLSRAFYRRPAIRGLVPDLKLLLTVLTVGCETHCGTYRPVGLSEDTGLDMSALGGGLNDLERRGLLSRDAATGEVFISDFFRDNTFMTPARKRQAKDDFLQVESTRLAQLVRTAIRNNPACGLTECDLEQNQSDITQGEGKGEGKPPPPPPDVTVPAAWAECLELEIELARATGTIKSEPALRRAILSRYGKNGGPSDDVIAELARREEQRRHAALRQADRVRRDAEVLANARAGADLLPPGSRLGQKVAAARAARTTG